MIVPDHRKFLTSGSDKKPVLVVNHVETSRSRVAQRVSAGERNVPDRKIDSRFPRTFDNLQKAIHFVDRAFLFDNSSFAEPYRPVAMYEAAELNELFLWKKPEEADPARVREELADVLIFALMLLEKYGLDLEKIVLEKLVANEEKYPADKARNSAVKYTDL